MHARPNSPGRYLKDVNDRVIYITGGSSGIGLATARLLAAKGGHILLLARDEVKLAAARSEVEAARRWPSQRIATLSVDVTDPRDVTSKMDEAVARLGPPDILIHSAGAGSNDHFEAISWESFDRVVQTNLYGVRNVTAALLPVMKARGGGRIAIIASMAGLVGMYGYTAYGTSKYALVGLAECLRSELKPFHIPVTLICPPEVSTPLVADEARTISPQAKAVKLMAGVLTPQSAARAVVNAIQKGRFLVVPGLKARLIYLSHCLTLGWGPRVTADLVIRYMMKKKKSA
jgi:NAD(P)-dependent dehydrogenase (short-subunit alcohol dehydrogenase family)